MDIKLRARLTAYSKIESFNDIADDTTDHECNMTPVSKELVDELFKSAGPSTENSEASTTGKSFIDSLF